MATLSLSTIRQNLIKFEYSGLGIPALVLMIMGMLVLPLPPLLLDFLFTFNIVASLVIIMIAIGTPIGLVVCHDASFGVERGLNSGHFGSWPRRS
jgi:flagellar biosynthesis component FlhA